MPNKKLKLDKSDNDEGRRITAEDYENDFIDKPVSIGLNTTKKDVGGNQKNVQAIECYNFPGIINLSRKPVVLNGEKTVIVAQIVQLIISCF